MKKYPKNLADLDALRDCVTYLYSRAEELEVSAEYNAQSLEEEPENEWYQSEMNECRAKAEAFVRLAEKLTK